MKLIHAHVYNPTQSLFGDKKGRCKCTTIRCNRTDDCELLDDGSCLMLGFGPSKCPYGDYRVESGYTKRARKFYEWMQDRREKYKDVPSLSSPGKTLAIVGDHIYLPYAHMDMGDDVPIVGKMIAREDFTAEAMEKLCRLRPMPIFGYQPIAAYQKEVVPLFVKHLSEKMPDLFAALAEAYPRAVEIIKAWSNVGRKAVLNTLLPNVGTFVDCHHAHWTWDGEWLTAGPKCSASFMLVSKFEEIMVRPTPGAVVAITDENQVTGATVFVG